MTDSMKKWITSVFKNKHNNPEAYANVLKPILSWDFPERDQKLIAVIYREYSERNRSKCIYCDLMFSNDYIRDFHLHHCHNNQLYFTCYDCREDEDADETEQYFPTWCNLQTHRNESHGE